MIRALIFDCFGVLYRDNLGTIYDLVPDEKNQEVYDIIRATDYGIISRQDYFDKIAELSGKTPDDIRAVEDRQFSRNEQLIEKVQELKADYKIGLLSNIGDETMDRLFPENERSELFDSFVLSSQVGMVKPSVAIFELSAERLGIPLHECVMIDDIPANVESARLAGMQAILFTTNHQFEIDFQQLLERDRA